MRTLHLFAGAGGGLLADVILGHEPVCAVELDPYCCAVLRQRVADGWFPGLVVVEHHIEDRGILGDACTIPGFDPHPWRGRVDCIHAGFPCQDISVAGAGAGIHGRRSGLYREAIRCIEAIQPQWVFLENVPAIRTRGRHIVIADLVALGYAWRDGILSALDVGAPHRRDRWWLLARRAHPDADSGRREGERQSEHGRQQGACGREPDGLRETGRRDGSDLADPAEVRCDVGAVGPEGSSVGSEGELQPGGRDRSLADTVRAGLAERVAGAVDRSGLLPESAGGRWWDIEPDVGRVAYGVADRVDRLRALGNGQVALCAAAAWRLLGGP